MLGSQLKAIRRDLGMRRIDLANALGVRWQTIWAWEEGVKRITERTKGHVMMLLKAKRLDS